jgi:hypothetical protein
MLPANVEMRELHLQRALGEFPLRLANARACWGITLLISCWCVWRDVVKKMFVDNSKEEVSGESSHEHAGDDGKDVGHSGGNEQSHDETVTDSQNGLQHRGNTSGTDEPRNVDEGSTAA